MKLIDPQIVGPISAMQSLDDAIAYRKDRLCIPCQDCTPETPCTEHSCDQALIARYQERHAAALRDLLADLNLDDVAQVTPVGNDISPTATAVGLVLLARLRQEAANGPVMVRIDGAPVVMELDGDFLVESPLPVADVTAPK